ncbi:HTH domain-containing protein [Natrarchaeobaculum aegyptiacum]|uniref:Uncharacterized protein n=1 Tax=Natrarchaeobaculum aegyptiacum TaxID=745377 RepID=A0A2Z2HYV1_9EURY|nr:HTH domain-containing protein [Natrarchaeobaculum aegyptiacum]ARS91595.1 hypothetical protein B1756_18950 [Natrarchaeobaculum aegyptiacum]
MTSESPALTVVCHVRAPLLLEPIDRQVETLTACESEGAIDDVLVRSWPKEVSLSESTPHQEVLESYERFSEWADRRGVSIEPPFRTRTNTSQITGETTELLVTPLCCLEVYADDDLVGVFPHTDGDETVTTDEVIAQLRTGEVPTPLGATPTRVESESWECPTCGGPLVDGQGLFACSECGWLGTVAPTGDLLESPAGEFATLEGESEADPGEPSDQPLSQ